MTTNEQIAVLLVQFADLLDIKGESGFRVSAYRRGADTIRHLDEPAERLLKRDELTSIKGIGKGLAAIVSEIVNDGRFAELEELQDEVPATLLTMLDLPGIGPKTVGRLYRELAITNIEDLEKAARAGQVRELRGMGQKQEQRILDGIAFIRQRTGRVSIGVALPAARQAKQALENALDTHVMIAGSTRRHAETVGNIDLLAVDADLGQIEQVLRSEFEIESAEPSGSSLVLDVPALCQVRIITTRPELAGSDLLRLTGSASHVERLEEIGKLGAQESENDAYEALNLTFIPPELREGRGEVEAAAIGSLPDLVDLSAIRGDLHLHSTWSDGRASISELAQRAQELGYEFLSIADHSRSLAIANGLTEERLRGQREEIDAINEKLSELKLIRASEVEILRDGHLDFPDEILAELDLVVASLHSGRGMSKSELTSRLLNAIENPHVDIIGHPTGRIIEQRPPAEFDWDAVFEAAVRTGTALEINANPARLDLPEELARAAVDAGVLISINSDAHSLAGLDLIEYGVGIARRGWVPRESVINCWSRDRLFDWLER